MEMYQNEVINIKELKEYTNPLNEDFSRLERELKLITSEIKEKDVLEKELTKKTQLSNPKELLQSMENISNAIQEGTKVSEEDINNVELLLSTYFENNVDKNSIEYEMYLYNSELMKLALDKHPQVSYVYDEISKGIYTKVYFSKKLKEKYPNPVHINYFEDEASAQEKSYKKTK